MFRRAGELVVAVLASRGGENALRIAPPFKETKETKSYAATVSFVSLSPLSPSERSRQNAKTGATSRALPNFRVHQWALGPAARSRVPVVPIPEQGRFTDPADCPSPASVHAARGRPFPNPQAGFLIRSAGIQVPSG